MDILFAGKCQFVDMVIQNQLVDGYPKRANESFKSILKLPDSERRGRELSMKVKVSKRLVLLFIMIFALSAVNLVNARSTLAVSATITVGQFPNGVAYDSGKGEIFVCNLGDGNVSVISDITNAVVATIPVGRYPREIDYDSGKGEIFVANSGDNTVSIISDSTNSVVATVTVGSNPRGVAYDSSKGEVFVCNADSHSVSVISDSTNTVVATITVGDSPTGIAYDSGKNEIFVSNSGSPSISVIRDSDNTVVATIDMGGNAVEGLAYASGKGEIFVADYNAAAVSVISDQTNSVVKEISLGVYGGDPQSLAYNPPRGEIIVPVQHLIIISESNNAIVDEASINVNNLVYDLGRGEIFALINAGNTVKVISGSSETSPSVNPTTSSSTSTTTSASPTPSSGSPSFSMIDWLIVIIVVVLVLILVILFLRKRQHKAAASPSEAPKITNSGNAPDNEGKTNGLVAQQQHPQIPIQSAPILAPTPPPPPNPQEPAEPQGWRDEKIQEIIQKFQEKGAISPQTAMTAKELGLSRIFVRIMERRKEQTKIFVEINGKYYLDQKALEEKKQ